MGTVDGVADNRPVVLALHGQPGAGLEFGALARALPGFCVLAPDRPGWGERAGEEAGGFATNAADAVSVLDRAGAGRAVVLGYSWAGGVALEMARRFPERVAALVLAASVGPGEPTPVDRILALPGLGPVLSAAGLAAGRLCLRRQRFRTLVGHGLERVDDDHACAFADHCLGLSVLPRFMVEQRALVEELPGVLAGLAEVRPPTCVVAGDGDRLVAPATARRLAKAIPGAELRMIPDAGHFLPAAFAEALAEAVVDTAARAEAAPR